MNEKTYTLQDLEERTNGLIPEALLPSGLSEEAKKGLQKKYYEQEEVEKMIADAVAKAVKEKDDEIEIARIFKDYRRYTDEICKNEYVIKTRNILATDYQLRGFIELVERVGFERVNAEFMKRLDEKQKGIAKEEEE